MGSKQTDQLFAEWTAEIERELAHGKAAQRELQGLQRVLAVLVERAGGRIEVTDHELVAIDTKEFVIINDDRRWVFTKQPK